MRVLVLGAACIASFAASGQELVLEPREVEVRRMTETVTLNLSFDGVPVPADSLGSVSVLVDDNNYIEMFRVGRGDGVLTLTPTDAINTGYYDLVIETAQGVARGVVRVTLSDDPMTLENRARALDIPVAEMRARLGLAERSAREGLRIEVPPLFLTGQRLEASLKPPDSREYVWTINGQVAASGRGPHAFTYLFKRPGAYSIRYQERQNGVLVADLAKETVVEDEPALPWEVTRRSKLFVPGPEGFEAYEWRVDGELVSTMATLRHTFMDVGEHRLECVATSEGPEEKYRKITYAVSVL